MPYDPRNFETAIVSLLTSSNTTTASVDLSQSLTTAGVAVRVADNSIFRGNPKNAAVGLNALPGVWVAIDRDEEDFADLGPGANRHFNAQFTVWVAAPGTGMESGHDDAREQMLLLARNVKTILRQNVQPTTTIVWLKPTLVSYDTGDGPGGEGIYTSAARIEVAMKLMST